MQDDIKVIERGKDTGIIEISLERSDKNKIVVIENLVSAKYILQNIQRVAQEAKNSLDFLDEQIPNIKNYLIQKCSK